MRLNKYFILLIFLTACGAAPIRDFKVTLYEPEMEVCQNSNETGELCPNDEGYRDDLVTISLEDYFKERNYQDLLIKKCDKWKE